MGSSGAATARTPAKTPAKTPTTKKAAAASASTGKQQKSILGFFAKSGSSSATKPASTLPAGGENSSPCLKESTKANNLSFVKKEPPSSVPPVPSSDPPEALSSQENREASVVKRAIGSMAIHSSSPIRSSKQKTVNYAESSDDEDEDVFASLRARESNRRRRPRPSAMADDDEDEFKAEPDDAAAADEDEDMDDFIVDDESDSATKSKKRKRANTKSGPSGPARKRTTASSSPPRDDDHMAVDADEEMPDEMPAPSTAQQWRFDPNNPAPSKPRESVTRPAPKSAPSQSNSNARGKAHTKPPEERHAWLSSVRDMDMRSPGDPDYDKSTLYVPPHAWSKFSPFEKQYWEIKHKLWDTVVFFKKGKFYELYENDATIGHQMFDLKMTDRVNMRMVGVPESSLDMWVNQFVAKGFKVARVDQMESALGKEMRERDDAGSKKKSKEDKIIRRELACVLTGGTLVEGSMLQDDMATYCVAIKESTNDEGLPAFGVAFVDAATGQFFLSEFVDDVDITKFETLIAQISPRELLLEKSRLSSKALKILKNNTAPTTIWNQLKPGTEFWEAETAKRELECSGYFLEEGADAQDEKLPAVLLEARDKDLVMSALGALVQYLRALKLERSLISQGNFQWYNPIHRNGTLVLDGQTLINLEVLKNTANGGPEGTLFQLLNRCITPFGKRLFLQWVCHPLCNVKKINERLDAVDMLNANGEIREQFSSQMSKMPDLERLISRIHAGICKPEDFVRVLDGFEQINYTMTLLEAFDGGNGLIDRLIASMPDLKEPLGYWKSAFDRSKARSEKLLVPERGIDEDFDNSTDNLKRIKAELNELLMRQKSTLKCKTIKFTDIGKEIYQMEVPKATKVPNAWRQMSATSSVKRYYFGELDELVRELQEAEETHSQVVKSVGLHFCRRFDEDYEVWVQAIRIVAQLDCLVSLAKVSSSLGEPSCRPVFVDDERSVLEFSELRHPCMLNTVDDFIPNDVKLGGEEANINLLTGANAAGKSTILRMTCIAVIMGQVGCYVPAVSARLTPVDRIMSRLGANDNIFAAQSTFFVELSETKKILSEATSRSLVILDELGRGTSSYDGVAVAQAVLHHVASHIGCLGFFATHYHSLATEFEHHPEIRARRMQIEVDDEKRRVTFLYRLEDGVAEGSFGMHCAAMCGINTRIVERAEVAAREWEHTSRLKESLDRAKTGCYIPLGILSDVAALMRDDDVGESRVSDRGIDVLLRAIEAM